MQTNLEKVIDDIKKRPADQPLSLPELHQLKEIPYADLIKEPALIKLLVRYSKESNFPGLTQKPSACDCWRKARSSN